MTNGVKLRTNCYNWTKEIIKNWTNSRFEILDLSSGIKQT